MIMKISPETTVKEFSMADGFLVPDQESEEAPQKPKAEPPRKIDHGKIIALYTANPPRSVSWIADEIGCSVQTVINHLQREGIYKGASNEAVRTPAEGA